jgi:hypothetical protein
VFSGRGLCDELITRPEDSYRLWRVVVCDLETSRMRRPWPALGRIINLWNWCILLVDLFESYNDARTGERQIKCTVFKCTVFKCTVFKCALFKFNFKNL